MAAPRCAGVLLATLAASVTLALGAVPAAADDSAPYGDTSPDAFYYEAVEALARDGVFAGTGCEEGFCPGEPLDRATMAVWTVRVLDGEDPDPVGSTRFADVDASHPYAAFIERFAELGVTSGCGDGTIYCPDGTVTRAQMAVFLSRAFSLDDGPDPGFSDVAPDAWYAPGVAKLAASGITEGCGDGTNFCPSRPTTRAQMAVFLHRALELPDQPTDATYEGDALGGTGTIGTRTPTEGDWVIPVFVCAPVGKYTAVDLEGWTAILNDELDGFFGRLSSQRMTLRFVAGSVLSDNIDWNYPSMWALKDGVAASGFPCGEEATSQAGTSQVLILVDVDLRGVGGFAWLSIGPAVISTPAAWRNQPALKTTVHELAHSVLGLHHLKYANRGPVFVNEFASDFLTIPMLACYQYEQLDWPVPDYASPCVRLSPSAPESVSFERMDHRGVVIWEPPVFTDDAEVTGYTVQLYKDILHDDHSSTPSDVPFAEYELPAGARAHSFDLPPDAGVYRGVVTAHSKYGEGDSRSAHYSFGPVPPPFGPIRIVSATHETIQLAWNTESHENYREDHNSNIVYEIRYAADGTAIYEETWGRNAFFDTTFRLEDLSPGTEYTISVRACSERLDRYPCDSWKSITASTFTESELPAPDPISVSAGSDWYLLTWHAVPGAEGYLIDVPHYGGEFRTYTPDFIATYGVQPDTTYSVRVGSCGSNPYTCEPDSWTEVSVTTNSEATIPPPYRLGLREVGDSWASVLWETNHRWLERVEYEYTDGVTSSSVLSHGAQTLTPLLLDVEPNTTYTLNIRNCSWHENSTECSTWTSFEFSTHPAASLVAAPSIRATDVADTWLGFSWERVPGASSYDWRYKRTADNSRWIWGNTTESTLETHWGLDPNTSYTAQVRSCGEPTRPCSDWAATTASTVRSLPLAPSSYPVSVKTVTDNQIHLAWNPPAQGMYYTARLFSIVEQHRSYVDELYYTTADRAFSRLEPNTSYTIAVRTCQASLETLCDDWVAINVSTRPSR